MPKIVFQFHGGSLDGRSIEGSETRSLSTAYFDPVLRHWFDTEFGTTGRRFVVPAGKDSSNQSVYEVIGRAEDDQRIVVAARHISESA
jgi:hypothetical protein